MAVLASVLALAAALLRRWQRRHGAARTLEALVLVGAGLLALAGLLAGGLAVLGVFSAAAVVFTFVAAAVLVWPWGQAGDAPNVPRPAAPDGWRVWLAAAALTALTLLLRVPTMPAELAGRDPGTYVLRARHTLRTGGIGLVDPVLAAAGRDEGTRPGPGDILGLYPVDPDPARQGRYEAAYRPGFYLQSRARGEVVPQFLHLHPVLLATSGLVFGPHDLGAVLYLEAVLAVLALWALGRRLWPRGPWALLAAGLYALSPIAVWVHRTPLTEPLTGLLLLAAALALARGWRERVDHTVLAALLLGATAWIRGNAWLTAVPLFAVLWLRPDDPAPARFGRRLAAPAALFALLVASLAVHVETSFPYLHDELARQLGRVPLSLATVLVAAALAAAAWLLADRLLRPLRGRVARLPGLLVVAAALAILAYAAAAMGTAGAPWSRLDPTGPLLGATLLLAAAAGALRLAAARLPADVHAVWLAALATVPLATLALYAQRNLPHVTLYYYGRYLVPELLPLACLLAAHALAAGHDWLSRRTGESDLSPRTALLADLAAGALALVLLAAQAWPYIVTPVTRLQEFVGAERAIDALAAEIPADAVVIAGGEGWHSAHTFNQVGGALALGHGRTLLPYRSPEAAYAALHELLLGPRRPAPRVFLLLNEASHLYRPRDHEDRPQAAVAAIDASLPPPFVARPVGLVELIVDRLTPVEQVLPTRVTRADLRMGLFEVEVDPALQASVRAWDLASGRVVGPPGLVVRGPGWSADALCLDPAAPRVLEFDAADTGPVSLVLVAGPGGTRGLGLTVDDAPLAGDRGPRDTLGPFVLASAPRRLEILGDPRPRQGQACPHGGLVAVRLLTPSAPPDPAGRPPPWARTFAPLHDLGHAVEPIRWVAGTSISRARPATPTPEAAGPSFMLREGKPLEFAPVPVPGDSRSPHDLVVNLRNIDVGPRARLEVWDGDTLAAEVDPPDAHYGIWQAPPVPWQPRGPLAQIGLLLVDPDRESARLQVRDVALFDRTTLADSVIAAPPPG
ncbi:MAG: hypothetical protein JNL82_06315 [Myxococcales bacterium]|nr:hypothetical protein [Myxococcales bacterium]